MPQPNLFSSDSPHGLPTQPEAARGALAEQHEPHAHDGQYHQGEIGSDESIPLWLRRLDLLLRVIVRIYLGLLLVALPWMHFWSDNYFFTLYSTLGTFAESGAVRGLISGLGLLNLWIAIAEAVHYKDSRA